MQTGKITNVQPTVEVGYSGQNGYIYTFKMSIQFPDGVVTGEIGSKSQQYPLNAGQDISVEITNTEYGPKFKKVNPQYANQGCAQGGGQQHGQPNTGGFMENPKTHQPNAPQATGQPNVQDDIRFAQSLNLAVSDHVHGKIDEPAIESRTKMYYAILKTRIFPAFLSSTSPVFEQQPSADDVPWGT